MSYSPIHKFKNVNMEVDVAKCSNTPSGNDPWNNLADESRLEVPTFSLSGITYEKSNNSSKSRLPKRHA